MRKLSRARLEILCRILGINTHLDGSALRLGLMQEAVFPGALADHPFHKIDAGDPFRDTMLDL